MMADAQVKQNCWEFMACGRQPGGESVAEFGECPAAVDSVYHGLNGGVNAGRVCWARAGTFCDGRPPGTFAQKLKTCLRCDFFESVRKVEGVTDAYLLQQALSRRDGRPKTFQLPEDFLNMLQKVQEKYGIKPPELIQLTVSQYVEALEAGKVQPPVKREGARAVELELPDVPRVK